MLTRGDLNCPIIFLAGGIVEGCNVWIRLLLLVREVVLEGDLNAKVWDYVCRRWILDIVSCMLKFCGYFGASRLRLGFRRS